MNHLNDTQIKRMILKEAVGDELRSRELHLETCARCRVAVDEARLLWEALGAGDPARSLDSRPLWPAVAEALDRSARPDGAGARQRPPVAATALAPRWRFALGETFRQPVALAAMLAAVVGVLGGHAVGNLLLGLPAQVGPNDVFASIPEASFLSGPAEGSLAAAYLDGYLSETGFPDDEGSTTDQVYPSEGSSPELPYAGNPDSSAGRTGGDR